MQETPLPIRIAGIELREIRLALKERFVISSGFQEDRRILLLRLSHPDGPDAWSECVAGERPNYSPDTIDTSWLAIRDWLAPRVLGREFESCASVHETLAEHIKGHRMARGAIEMGAWGLTAVTHGRSLASLVGGTRDQVATGISLGIQKSPAELVERALAAFEQGYRKVKIKIRPGEDVELVEAVRAAAGPDVALAVDANAAYTLETSDPLERLDGLDLIMIEQPLAAGDVVKHAALQRRLRTPICLDESITRLADVEDMLELGSGRIVNIKPGRVGGFTESIAIHDLCAERDIPVWCGGMLESGIGRAYNVAIASLPNFRLPGDLSPSARYWERDVVNPEWTMSADGYVAVPHEAPGLGVAVDIDRIDDLTVRAERLTG